MTGAEHKPSNMLRGISRRKKWNQEGNSAGSRSAAHAAPCIEEGRELTSRWKRTGHTELKGQGSGRAQPQQEAQCKRTGRIAGNSTREVKGHFGAGRERVAQILPLGERGPQASHPRELASSSNLSESGSGSSARCSRGKGPSIA